MSHAIRNAATLVLVLSAVAISSCGHRLQQSLLPDVRPEVRLTHTRLAAPDAKSYAWLARWTGAGAGVPVDHYVYAVDPVSIDRIDASWVATKATEQVLTFAFASDEKGRHRAHVFAVRAVSASGKMSDPDWFAFTESNLPPVVQITNPVPSAIFTPIVPPSVRISWQGNDPDGQTTNQPVRYVFRLFGHHNPDFPAIGDWIDFARTYPDSVRALYAPDFNGWESVGPEVTSKQYLNLVPNSIYLFAITAFDEAGDYDPVFSLSKNLLTFGVTFEGVAGPQISMFNEFFNYTYPTGGYFNTAERTIHVEMPAGQPATINWFGIPIPGSNIRAYRWVLNPVDLTDETPRTNEATDLHHWSQKSLSTTSATLPPVNPPLGRRLSELLYIEAEDSNGLRSLGIVDLSFQRPAFNQDLLFVDDTRLRPDFETTPGVTDPPAGPWPTAAELDTFLFARGGFPWRGYPVGSLSSPGIFNGYAFDTASTRALVDALPLSMLGRYRHVVWYTDEATAALVSPMATLRDMNLPGHSNSLATYIGQGGLVWLCGGGAAYATLIAYNKPNTSPLDYTNDEPNPELRPGRFMYDFAHWRSGIQMLPAVNVRKYGTTTFGIGDNRPGRGWPPNPISPTPPSAPDYSLLPSALNPKSTSPADPPPPLRTAGSDWYRGVFNAEYINRPTYVREDYNDDPNVVDEYSTLDTLYIVRGGTALPNSPAMTYYHGRDNQPLVFSGFNFWYWKRSECIGLVDWVLQSVWGLPRDGSASRAPALARGSIATVVRAAQPVPAARGAASRNVAKE